MTSDATTHGMGPIAVARTVDGYGFAYTRWPIGQDVLPSDILVLRDASGGLVPARLMGMVAALPEGEVATILAGVFRVDDTGIPLERVAGTCSPVRSSGSDTWGALGLPDGWMTKVRRMEDRTRQDDLRMATASAGHAMFASSRALSIGPGDRVMVHDASFVVVQVDRRLRTIVLGASDGEQQTLSFDDIDTLGDST